MTRFMRELKGEFGEYWFQNALKDISRMFEKFHNGEIELTNGVARWKSSNNVLPEDCCEMLKQSVHEVDLVACKKAREEDDAKFFEEYRKRMENYVPSEEELYEMECAFGKGAKVVNVITGKVIQL